MPKVTVALSVYNAMPFLKSALDCIIKQSFYDIEILCIDDCSTDDTLHVLHEYSIVDERIRIIEKSMNQGLSASRNLAMKEAKGEYIIMLDGDDLFDYQMVEKAYKTALLTSAEMILWDYTVFLNDNNPNINAKQESTLTDTLTSDKIALLRRPGFMWTRMIKLDTARSLNLHFPEGLTKQDIPVHWKLITLLPSDKIAIIPEKLVHYRQSNNNTTSRKDKSLFALAAVMDIVYSDLINENLYDTYKNEFWRSRLTLLQGMYDTVLPEYKEEALKIIFDRLNDDAYTYLNSPECSLSKRVKSFYGMLNHKKSDILYYKTLMFVRYLYRNLKHRI